VPASRKGGKQIEHCLISTFQVAESIGFKGRLSPMGALAANWRLQNSGAFGLQTGSKKSCAKHSFRSKKTGFFGGVS
jgi:hypothetical protein